MTWLLALVLAVPIEPPDPPPAKTAPAVAAPAHFRGYNASHKCPECGRSVFVQSGRGPKADTHWHVCSCGAAWWHRDK